MKEIKRYALKIFGGPKGSGQGKRASIYLFNKDNHAIGSIDFWEEGTTLPADALADNGLIQFSLFMNRYEDVVDMLRNESPVFVAWQESLKNAYIGTSQEPVGEGE